jgi:oligo-1,6-glucosidase
MVFQFAHVMAGWDPVYGKWKPRPFDLVTFKRVMSDWQAAMADDGWNSLFLSNHDLPRQVSKYGDDGAFRVRSAKCLATLLHLMKGTPFVYQGEEIGMTNASFTRMAQFRDVETLGQHADQMAAGVSEADFIAGANANGRDNARTPMQWSAGPHAGFTDGEPWIEVNPNHAEINVEADRSDPDGVFAHYRALIAARKAHPVIVEGRFALHAADHPQVMAYVRTLGEVRLAVLANVSGAEVDFEVPAGMAVTGRCLVANVAPRDRLDGRVRLAPWEAVAVLSA